MLGQARPNFITHIWNAKTKNHSFSLLLTFDIIVSNVKSLLRRLFVYLTAFKQVWTRSNLFKPIQPHLCYTPWCKIWPHDNKLCFSRYLQFLWDTLLCIERKHLPWEKPSALTSFNSSHFLPPHLNTTKISQEDLFFVILDFVKICCYLI